MLRREPCIILTTVVFNLGRPRSPASIRSIQAIPEHEELLYGFPVSPSSFAPLPAVLSSPQSWFPPQPELAAAVAKLAISSHPAWPIQARSRAPSFLRKP